MKSEAGMLYQESCRFRIRNKQVLISFRGREHRVFHSVGIAYLIELVMHPGVPVSYQELETALQQPLAGYRRFEGKEALLQHGLQLQEKPLPYAMTDKQTLGSIKQRLLQIIAELAELEEYNDYSRADDLREEQEALMLYLRQVYRPGGRLRSFSDAATKLKHKILKALRRALADIAGVDVELAAYIRASLELNEYLVYRNCGLEIDVCTV
jgi:tRNA(Ile)-lysidine synthase TilS/MesJ